MVGSEDVRQARPRSKGRGGAPLAAALAMAALLGGCADLQYAWQTVNDDLPAPERLAVTGTGLEQDAAPDITSVPTTRPTVSTPEQREALQASLRGDYQRGTAAMNGGNQGAELKGAEVPPAYRQQLGAKADNLVGLVYFPDGATGVNANGRRVLRQVAELAKTYGGRVEGVGHSSRYTRTMSVDRQQEVNMRVSQQRAAAVQAALQRYGLGGTQVVTRAVGDEQPIFDESMPTGRAGNRRVEIYLNQG